jgi:outer membrane immunogenic protein
MIRFALALATITCFAAPTSADEPVPAMSAAWSGWYMGVHAGAAQLDGNMPSENLGTETGFAGGALAGYRWQHNRLIYGLEADISFMDIDSTEPRPCTTSPGSCASGGTVVGIGPVGRLRGLAGSGVTPALSLFIAGGLAVGETRPGVFAEVSDGTPLYAEDTDDEFETGYTIGGGFEWRHGANWLMRGEVIYDDFGSRRFSAGTAAAIGGCCSSTITYDNQEASTDLLTGRIAIIYLFD